LIKTKFPNVPTPIHSNQYNQSTKRKDDELPVSKSKLSKSLNEQYDIHKVNAIFETVLTKFENSAVKCGAIINPKKTERVFVQINDNYNIKSKFVWLGISFELNNRGFEANIPKTLQDIRIKTFQSFNHICSMTNSIQVRRKIFLTYIEPVISYHLVVIFMCKNFNKTLQLFQVLQNQYLRKVATVGNYTTIDSLHEILNIRSVEFKVNRLASNIWENLEISKSYRPIYNSLRTKSLQIKRPEDKIYSCKLNFEKADKKFAKFDLEKFKIWQRKMHELGEKFARNDDKN